jgi:hypothetical protein
MVHSAEEENVPRVGVVVYPGGDTVVERYRDGRWKVTTAGHDDPVTASMLEDIYKDEFGSPSLGDPIMNSLSHLAARKGVPVHFDPEPPPNDPPTIY